MIRRLLFPFSLIYLLITELRNFAFRRAFLKTHKLPCRVISVGNLCAGGTGKTPFVIALAEYLKPHFSHITIISRGYGRSSKGARCVSVKGTIQTDVLSAGDEPYQLAKRLPFCSVVVAEKRIEGYNLIRTDSPDLVILDDGFQHQYIQRDLNICLMNGHEPYANDMLLPAGNLREAIWNLKRADLLIETKHNSKTTYTIPHFFIPYKPTSYSQAIDTQKSVVLISGIAKPQLFEESVSIPFKAHYSFNDHHTYQKQDFKDISENDIILTTEKDYYKLLELALPNQIAYLKIDFLLSEELKMAISDTILT